MVILNIDELLQLRENNKDKKIVFCSGSFDLPHAGHVLFFEDCKKLGDILVVCIGSDRLIKSLKGGKRPILNENIRLKTIDSLKPVDYCFLNPCSPKEHPLLVIGIVFKKLKPDTYVINEDAFDIPHRLNLCKKYKVKLNILKRWCPSEFDDISTSKIIEKIKSL